MGTDTVPVRWGIWYELTTIAGEVIANGGKGKWVIDEDEHSPKLFSERDEALDLARYLADTGNCIVSEDGEQIAFLVKYEVRRYTAIH